MYSAWPLLIWSGVINQFIIPLSWLLTYCPVKSACSLFFSLLVILPSAYLIPTKLILADVMMLESWNSLICKFLDLSASVIIEHLTFCLLEDRQIWMALENNFLFLSLIRNLPFTGAILFWRFSLMCQVISVLPLPHPLHWLGETGTIPSHV